MAMQQETSQPKTSEAARGNWTYRWAVLLTLLTFPLIWLGGLVTTYDAGMAVPDWPGTYGYNLFAYPWQTWLFGPFDLLIEHGHRLLASVVGLVAIALVVSTYRRGETGLIRRLAWCCLGLVIFQGLLGGVRVLLDERLVAMVHGCVGPAFFALATATAVVCSGIHLKEGSQLVGVRIPYWALALALSAYLQLTIGAQLRHVLAWAPPKFFLMMVHTHLTLAGIVFLLSIVQLGMAIKEPSSSIRRPAWWLVFMVLCQIGLGLGTWVVNYAVPWEELTPWLAQYTIQAKGYWESMLVTAHVALGSLIISMATMLTTRIWLLRASGQSQQAKVTLGWKKQLA